MLDQIRAEQCIKKLKDIIYNCHLDIDKIFRKFDVKGDRNLTLQEFTSILKIIDGNMNEHEARIIFNIFDTDRSQTITPDEFKAQIDQDRP